MNQPIHTKLGFLGLTIAVIGSCSLYHSPSSQEDLSSSAKAKRSTQLGVAKQIHKKLDKEYDIKLVDPAMSQKWGLALTDSKLAWERHKVLGSKKIVVAVIDTGIDIKHPDLQNNLWVNVKEANGKPGVDDDNNGYIDDIHGWNFVADNSDLTDNHGHGTHIAGIIGAEGGNKIGISGVAPRVSLMALKYYDPKAPGKNNLMNTVRALKYAVDMNVDIINYSGGGLEKSDAEQKLIEQARRKGILIVAAAGNEKSNSDIHGYYPADYDLDNIISVTAIDQGKNVLPTSNYGITSVDIAAPGNNIYSTLPGGKYGYLTGTSQATAFVSGVAVLLKARFSDFDAQKIIKHILQTGDFDQRLIGKTRHIKRLNTYRALAILDQNVGRTGVVAANNSNIDHSLFTTEDNVLNNNFKFHETELQTTSGGLTELSRAIYQQYFKDRAKINNKL